MTRTKDEELKVRRIRRSKYFEDPHYYQWSKILEGSDDVHTYASRSDPLFVLSMITGENVLIGARGRHITVLELLEHKDDPMVNWLAIYDYVDEALSDKCDTELIISISVKQFLDDYRDILLSTYDMI